MPLTNMYSLLPFSRAETRKILTLFIMFCLAILVTAPSRLLAIGREANAMCTAAAVEEGTLCFDTISVLGIGTLRTTEGVCASEGVCVALSTLGIGGGMGDVGLGKVADFFKGIPGDIARSGYGMVIGTVVGTIKTSLFGGAPTTQTRAGTPIPGTQGGTQRCTSYYQVTVRSSDPCALYVPPTSQLPTNTSTQLLNSLRPPSTSNTLLVRPNTVTTPAPSRTPSTSAVPSVRPSTSNTLLNYPVNISTPNTPASPSISDLLLEQADDVFVISPASSAQVQVPVQSQTAADQSGVKGNIQLTSAGVTIQAGVRDASRNVESAGFFGSNISKNMPPQGFLERMCLVRPWQNPLISYSVPTSIFDNLCSARELRVGVSPGTAASAATSSATQTRAAKTSATSSASSVPPKADVWAVPASVAVGSRTSIFWNAKGVSSCSLSSSDGNFSAGTVSGNSASAPLTAPTFFFISCVAPGGSRVNNYVKVDISS